MKRGKLFLTQRQWLVAFAMVGLIAWNELYQSVLKSLEHWPAVRHVIIYR